MLVLRGEWGSGRWLLALTLWVACAGSSALPSHRGQPQKLLLVSFDGFRWNYDQDVDTPNLDHLRTIGVAARHMVPPFVTITSPSHYTLVTGKHIESHGAVHNQFYNVDPWEKQGYHEAQKRSEWWNETLPIWISAQKQGLKTGSLHFPGGAATYEGQTVYRSLLEESSYNYSNETEWRLNVDTVVDWFVLDQLDFVALYFGEPDSAGHKFGPDSEERQEKVRQVDRTVGYLLRSMEERGLTGNMNVIITSDHGMTPTQKAPAVEEIVLSKFINFKNDVKLAIVDYGPFAMIQPKQGREEAVYQALKGAHPKLNVYRKEEFPERFRYREHRRLLPIMMYGDLGYVVNGRMIFQLNKGEHGFDNAESDMWTIFRAFGPRFRQGYAAEPFASVHVYALMCELLGVQPEPHNGSLDVTRDMLVDSQSATPANVTTWASSPATTTTKAPPTTTKADSVGDGGDGAEDPQAPTRSGLREGLIALTAIAACLFLAFIVATVFTMSKRAGKRSKNNTTKTVHEVSL